MDTILMASVWFILGGLFSAWLHTQKEEKAKKVGLVKVPEKSYNVYAASGDMIYKHVSEEKTNTAPYLHFEMWESEWVKDGVRQSRVYRSSYGSMVRIVRMEVYIPNEEFRHSQT